MGDLTQENDTFQRCDLPIPLLTDGHSNANVSVNSYSPKVVGRYNLRWNHCHSPTAIKAYEKSLLTPVQAPGYREPAPGASFPQSRRNNGIIRQVQYASLLPLLITARRQSINIQQYDVVSERNSFRKIAMNQENYVVSVQRYGKTLFLRRHDQRQVNINDFGYRFEQLCTPHYHLEANYYQLIEGRLDDLRTLITAETDAEDAGQAIELKCKRNGCINDRDKREFWLQAFLSGVQTIIVGQPSITKPMRLESAVQHLDVADLIDDDTKNNTLKFLYKVLHDLQECVRENEVYLFSPRKDQRTSQYGFYLYRVVDKRDKVELTFISTLMLNELIIHNPAAPQLRRMLSGNRRSASRRVTSDNSTDIGFEDDDGNNTARARNQYVDFLVTGSETEDTLLSRFNHAKTRKAYNVSLRSETKSAKMN